MKNLSYGSLFEGWEVAIAKHLVNEFKKQWRCLDIDDFEDLAVTSFLRLLGLCRLCRFFRRKEEQVSCLDEEPDAEAEKDKPENAGYRRIGLHGLAIEDAGQGLKKRQKLQDQRPERHRKHKDHREDRKQGASSGAYKPHRNR